MTSNYYYLVAGLPDLLLDEGKGVLSCLDFVDEAESLLTAADLRLFNLLRLPFDNENLMALLEKTGRPFDRRATIDEAELTAALKGTDTVPNYMRLFIESFHENRPPVAGCTTRDWLAWFFYEAMSQGENEFIREWYSFDLALRNCIAGINSRKNFEHVTSIETSRDRPLDVMIVGRDAVAESVLKSSAADFGVATLFPEVDKVVAMSKNPLPEFEKGLDTLRWDKVNEMASALYFKAEAVFAFFIKLTIVERWQALDPDAGRERLNRLVEELKMSYSVPAGF